MENRVPHEPNQLPGGQQRGAIAGTLVNRPALLLADEPTGSLDSRSGPEIRDILHQVHRNGETIVLITHIKSVAISVAGGLLGVGTGVGLAHGFGVLVAKAVPDGGDWGTIIQASAVLAAFFYTIAVGVCLDLYPVLKASKLGPTAVSIKQPQTSESVKV